MQSAAIARCGRHADDNSGTGRIGHTANGDSIRAYHLMDFSRYFFDQSDIGR